MILSKDQMEELLNVSKPLIKWLNDNCHPHVQAIVHPDRVELLEGICMKKTEEFIKD